jgi:hypothetical protein
VSKPAPLPSKSPAAATVPPADRRELLAAADPRGRALYGLVRLLVDELEETAPWSLLYAPAQNLDELRSRIERLLDLVQAAPQRITEELDELTMGDALARAAREEAEFYFKALHQMTAPNRRLLSAALAALPEGAPLARAAAEDLSELAADLKGEYSSAIMGAASALVSEGRWLGIEVETTLFPEKAEERTRNRRFLAALAATAQALAALRVEFPWREVLERWRTRRPLDRYALTQLVAIRSHLLFLLTVGNRRALFSGDYQLLKRREIALSGRLRELEALHFESLELAPGAPEDDVDRIYERLCEILIEISAVLDLEVLRGMIGDVSLRRLRPSPTRPGTAPPPGEGVETGGASGILRSLLAEEDLTIFLELLLGAVTKRLSIAFESGPAADARVPDPAAPESDELLSPLPPLPPLPPLASPAPATAETPAGAPAGRRDPKVAARTFERLSTAVLRLTDKSHEPWRAFQMVHKLQERLRVLPRTLTAEMVPFLIDLRSELLPLIEEAGAVGVLPAAAAETLRSCERRLSGRDLSLPATSLEVGTDLARVTRLLGSLRAAVAARSK